MITCYQRKVLRLTARLTAVGRDVLHRSNHVLATMDSRNHLGTEADSIVYATELDGIRMAVETARDASPRSLLLSLPIA